MENEVTCEERGVVGAALERHEDVDLTTDEDLDYWAHLRCAIDALPKDEREVIVSVLAGIPIETKKDGEPSIGAADLACL